MNHKLSQEQYDALFNEDTSVKAFKEIAAQVNERVLYIVGKIDEIVGRKRDYVELLENLDSPNNFTSIMAYDSAYLPTRNDDFDTYDYDFPTIWLKDDFEAQLTKEVKEYEAEVNQKKVKRKTVEQGVRDTMANMKERILAKLSEEELAYISFKPFKEVIVDYDKAQAKKQKEEDRRAHLEYIAQFKDKPKKKPK